MSIGMFFVDGIDQKQKTYYLPIATEEVFRKIWLPVATRLSAGLILMFESGVEIDGSDMPALAEELLKLTSSFKAKPQSEEVIHATLRIQKLVEELERIQQEYPKSKVYIG